MSKKSKTPRVPTRRVRLVRKLKKFLRKRLTKIIIGVVWIIKQLFWLVKQLL